MAENSDDREGPSITPCNTKERRIIAEEAGIKLRGSGSFIGFFGNLHLTPELEDFGYGAERVASERVKVAALAEAKSAQEAAKGTARGAFDDQKAALAAMNEWVSQYHKIARIALRDRPKLLVKIGVKLRPTARKPVNRPETDSGED